ncbi:MAG: hypothetical protein JXR10_03445 [Cyclobacteriaceae bacterium]
MKARSLFILFLGGLFVFCSLDSEAQRNNKYKKQKSKNKSMSKYHGGSVGGKFRPYQFASFNINALNYYGDLAPVNRAASTDVSFTRPGFGGNIGYKFSAYGAFRAGFNYGRIKGDDITSDPADPDSYGRYLRNASFRSDIKEFHMGFEWYFIPNYGGPNVRKPINFYLFVGAAVFHHEPKGLVPDLDYTTGGVDPAPQAGEWVSLRKLGTEGQLIADFGVKKYSPIQFSIPIALGAKLRLPGPFDLGLEFGYRYLFTDYIDDVSGVYVPFDQFTDPLARIMSDRSAEPVAYWSGVSRGGVNVAPNTLSDGVDYYGAVDLGGGRISPEIPSRRGNPEDNDMIFMTTLKLTMLIGEGHRSSGKFR